MIDTGWKKEMERLYEKTAKNWWKTGNDNKPNGSNCCFYLGEGKKRDKNEK